MRSEDDGWTWGRCVPHTFEDCARIAHFCKGSASRPAWKTPIDRLARIVLL